ncbi:MAG: hypothetical protein NVSMB2_01220 [Chloroflexota bacterium]
MNVVFFLNRLHSHITREEYEHWIRSVDYPTARTISSIIDYKVSRIDALLEGGQQPPYEYIEQVVISNPESYATDLADPRLDAFKQQWSAHVAESIALRGTVIE